jgi:hypothetical protein
MKLRLSEFQASILLKILDDAIDAMDEEMQEPRTSYRYGEDVDYKVDCALHLMGEIQMLLPKPRTITGV